MKDTEQDGVGWRRPALSYSLRGHLRDVLSTPPPQRGQHYSEQACARLCAEMFSSRGEAPMVLQE